MLRNGYNADESGRGSSLLVAWPGTDYGIRVRAQKGRAVMGTCYWAGDDEGGKHVRAGHGAVECLI